MMETARVRWSRLNRMTGGHAIRRALVGLLLAPALSPLPAQAQTGGVNGPGAFTVRPAPTLASSPAQPGSPAAQPRAPGLLGVPVGSALSAAAPAQPGIAPSLTPPPLPNNSNGMASNASSPAALPDSTSDATGQRRRLVLTLHQLGAIGPLTLRGTSPLQGVQFGVRADEVVTAATLNLSGAMSPALLPDYSNVTVMLNEQYVGTIPVDRDHPRFDNLMMPVSPVFFQDNNRLNFRFTGRYTPECNDPLSGLLWSTISDTSTLTLTLERLPPQRDLSRLPLPFFDPHEKTLLSLPFVMPATPGNESLQAAGVAASWFGQLADYRGATFPVVTDVPSEGNAVLVVTGNDRPANVVLPPLNGPTLAVVPNPNDSTSSLLVIAGRTGPEAMAAAATLTLGGRTLSGDASTVSAPDLPKRTAYDAPAWIPSDRAVKFGELVDPSDLQVEGWAPGTVRVPFRTAPDLYTWGNRAFPMDIRYVPPVGAIEDLAVSRLDTGINDFYLASLPLAAEPSRNSFWFSGLFNSRPAQPSSRVDVPQYQVFGKDNLQFFFDARPLHRGDCADVPPPRMAVDPDSTFDISSAYRFAKLPNLAFFVSSGFPFTQLADLSDTAVVLPVQPTTVEVKAFLDLMGQIGSLTGYPVVRVAVAKTDGLAAVSDRNLLVMAPIARLGAAADLLKDSAFKVAGNKLSVDLPNGLDSIRRLFGDQPQTVAQSAIVAVNAIGNDTGVLVGMPSTLSSPRSVVALLGGSAEAVNALVTTLRDPDQSPMVQGDLALLAGGRFSSYRVGNEYTFGRVPFWLAPFYYLQGGPFGVFWTIVILLLILVLIVSLVRRLVGNRRRRVVVARRI